MTNFLVTGAAGFIGSAVVDRLLREGHRVIGFDNFSTGLEEFLGRAQTNAQFSLVRGDILDQPVLMEAMQGVEFVFHFAANADVRFGTKHPRKDLEQNTIGTFQVLEAMRSNGLRRIAFASTGSVYGEASVFPTPETAAFPVQTSFYGASKLAGEGLISAYCEGFGFEGFIFRFVSILGPRYTHGHVFDFYKKLRKDPSTLHVLGNGRQRKSYLHVDDCVEAMMTAIRHGTTKIEIYNLGVDHYCEVNDSIGWISSELNLAPKITYEGGERGWIGDNPFILLDCSKIRSLGWRAKYGIEEGVRNTLRWLQANSWVLERGR